MKKQKSGSSSGYIDDYNIITFAELSALPAVLFCNIHIKDINPIYFILMPNFAFLEETHDLSQSIVFRHGFDFFEGNCKNFFPYFKKFSFRYLPDMI